MKKLIPSLFAILIASVLFAAPAGAATVTNGSFSDGINGWTVIDKPASWGTWTTYSGGVLPISGNPALAPVDGSAVVSDQDEPMSSVIYQDIALESESTHQLSLSYWYDNTNEAWIVPNPLSFEHNGVPDLEFIRIDVASAAADPFSPAPSDILKTILAPVGSDPVTVASWTNLTADLSEFAGQTVRLRLVNTSNVDYLPFGVDNVAITSTLLPPPALSALKLSTKSYRLKKGKQGVTLSYSLDRAASVTAVIQRSAPGKRKGKSCVKPSKKNKKAKNCTIWKTVGSQTLAGVAGANNWKFNGKLRGKSLKSGSYRIALTPKSPTMVGKAKSVSFTVKAAKKKAKR